MTANEKTIEIKKEAKSLFLSAVDTLVPTVQIDG